MQTLKVLILGKEGLFAKQIFVKLPEESIIPVYYFTELGKAVLFKLKTNKKTGKRNE